MYCPGEISNASEKRRILENGESKMVYFGLQQPLQKWLL